MTDVLQTIPEWEGRYRLESEIVRGAYSTIFRGVCLETGERRALKILHETAGTDSETAARFQRECRLLEAFDHPGAVKVFEQGVTKAGQPYFVMELVEGETLCAMVGRLGPLSTGLVAALLNQIAAVLDYAHARQIVHRDIKPGNIMVTVATDGRRRVKVLDFGIAKILGRSAQQATVVTVAGMTVGTPDYMSPEQAMGRPVDALSDVYSLGVLLFGLLTGRLPFEGRNALHTMMGHVRGEVPSFADRFPGHRIPTEAEAVVRQALAKIPQERPPSAGDLARRFAEAVKVGAPMPPVAPPPRSLSGTPVATEMNNPPVTHKLPPLASPLRGLLARFALAQS